MRNMKHKLEQPASLMLTRRRVLQGTLGAWLLPIAGGAMLAGCGGGSDSDSDHQLAATPVLASVPNFRDLADAEGASVYRTAKGKALQRGVFYRSNALVPSAADLATLNTLDIGAVYDLRTMSEVASQPDILPQGAAYTNINIMGSSSAASPGISTAEDAIGYMENLNRMMVTDAGYRERLAELFTAMADGPHAQLYHCTAGKDRTGWVSAVLMSLVDVPQSDIMQNYLLTNKYTAAQIETQHQGMIAAYGQAYADAYYPLLGVQSSFLHAGLDQASESYGSMSGYITNGLGLSASVQSALTDRLLG